MSIALGRVGVRRFVWAVFAVFAVLLVGACSAGPGTDEEVGSVQGAVCSAFTITPSPASPQPVGAQVTVTASGSTCGAGETPEYIFYYLNSTGQYTLFRNWAASATAVWDTTGRAPGTYNIYAAVRPAGGAQSASAYLSSGYSLGNTCGTTTAFNTTPAAPQPAGTHVSLSSAATCTGGATAEFKYYYNPPAGTGYVAINTTYSSAPVDWNTATLPAGNYSILVYSRAVGNSSQYESTRYGGYTLGSASTICTSAGLSASPASPQAAGVPVTLTGTATGCSSPQFAYWYRLYGNTTWIQLRDFAAGAYVWDTTGRASGQYEVLVGARNTGNTGGADVYTQIGYKLGATCSAVTLTPSPTSPSPSGTVVTLTASATCPVGTTPEYSFYYRNSTDTANTLIRAYGAATVAWDTTNRATDNYALTVYARVTGNTSAFEASFAIGYGITGATLTSVVAGRGYHTCGVVNNGKASCWGENSHGELGNGTMSASSSLAVTVSGLTSVSAVAVGLNHSCALLTDGTVRCWGDSTYGQLGNGATTASSTPVTVTGLSGVTAISAGDNHTCALAGGTVSCWGYNGSGQVGSSLAANFPQATTPVAVIGISGATAVSAGGFHSCALVGGAPMCWGDNAKGQLGNGGTPTKSFTPVAATGISGATVIAAGEEHTCAVVGGAVMCWGDNTYGQLGNGSTTAASAPVSVSGISTATQASAGFVSSCALLSNNSVSCWGRNAEGELGNGSSTDSLTPTLTTNGPVASLSSGRLHSCVTLSGASAGIAQCWGYNALGQIGNGTTTDAHAPVNVTF